MKTNEIMQNTNKVITQFRCEKCSQIIGDSRYQCNTEQENGLVLLSEVSKILRNQNASIVDPQEVGIYKNLMCVCGIALGWFYLTASINVSQLTEVFVLLNSKILREMLLNVHIYKDDCCSKLSTISESSVTSDLPEAGDYMNSPPRDIQLPDGFDNKQEWVDEFKRLLEEKGFSGATPWRVAVRALEADARYARFRTLPQRKQLFHQHKMQRAKQEREQRRGQEKAARDRLERVLLTCGKVEARTPYARCRQLLASHDAWSAAWAAVAEASRRELLEEVRNALARREREAARAVRRECVRTLAGVLQRMHLPSSTTWHQAQALLLRCPRFAANASLLAMDKLDALAVFEEYVRGVERRERAAARRARAWRRRRIAREGRLARDAFQELLVERRVSGQLHALSLWKDSRAQLSSDPRYKTLLKHAAVYRGSTPLDLFKFFVEELKDKYSKDKKVVKKILEDHDFVVKSRTSYEELARLVALDERSESVDAVNLRLVHLALAQTMRQNEDSRRQEDLRHHEDLRRHHSQYK